MNDQNITCPQCGKEFPLSSTLTHQLDENIRKELSAEFEKEKKSFIEKEKIEMWNKAQEKAREKLDKELQDIKNANEEKDKIIKEQNERELDLLKMKRELEEKDRRMKIEMERQKDEIRKEAIIEMKKELEEENKLKLSEKDKQLEQMSKTIQDLKRQSEQGSMQIQGDAAETELKILLRNNFHTDDIDDVPTGIKGADLIQVVKTQYGVKSGIILWESKNTKTFSQEWIKKLKDDMVQSKADMAILITKILPEGIDHFDFRDGVWIVESRYVLALTRTLRMHLINISSLKQSMVGSDQKMEQLYKYIYSNEFTNKVRNVLMSFSELQKNLDQERRAMQKLWSRREKEIERLIENTTNIYGELEGSTGKKLPIIEILELPGMDDDSEKQEELTPY